MIPNKRLFHRLKRLFHATHLVAYILTSNAALVFHSSLIAEPQRQNRPVTNYFAFLSNFASLFSGTMLRTLQFLELHKITNLLIVNAANSTQVIKFRKAREYSQFNSMCKKGVTHKNHRMQCDRKMRKNLLSNPCCAQF